MNMRTYTIDQFIEEYKEESISYGNFTKEKLIEKLNGSHIIIPFNDYLIKYDSVLKGYLITLQMTDQECNRFFNNPKALSYELYGTTELWFLLLHANEMRSVNQFTKNPLLIYSMNILDALRSILNLEDEFIAQDKSVINDEIIKITSDL